MEQLLNKPLQPGIELRSATYTYIIKSVLGQGAFGITYLATTRVRIKATIEGALGKLQQDRWEDMPVTIKEFFMKDTNSRKNESSLVEGSDSQLTRNYRKKFCQEAKNLSCLDHPNIVKVLEVFDANNTSYYVMEYIEGKNLDECIPANGMEENEAKGIIYNVTKGLKYMHNHKMLHLDIKPKNIMISPDGVVKLIDFGLSKQYNENNEPESSTSIGLGTPGYAPLEQSNYKQDGAFPATLDIYALGATYYKMLTGNTPPLASDVLDEGLPQLPEHLSLESVKMIEASMQPRKRNRPQNVDALIALLSKSTHIEETKYESEDNNKDKVESNLPRVEEPIIYVYRSETAETSDGGFIRRFIIGMVAMFAFISVMAFIYHALTDEIDDDYEDYDYSEVITDSIVVDNTVTEAHKDVNKKQKYSGSQVLTTTVNKPIDPREPSHQADAKDETNTTSSQSVQTHPRQESIKVNYTNSERKAIIDNLVANMVRVRGGSYMMGSSGDDKDAKPNEKPQHKVTLSNFSIGKYEVTQEEWGALMGNNPSHVKGPKLPVTDIEWGDCIEFTRKLNEYLNTNTFRLPTEAEWEFAAKGGVKSKGYPYAGSDVLSKVAWHEKESGMSSGKVHNVGLKEPNELGLYDMTGNVSEWCNDVFTNYTTGEQNNPNSRGNGAHIIRGGNVNSPYENFRVTYRISYNYYSQYIGFRLASN